MKQIAIASGKGGVGKTSLAAAFASFAKAIFADCDVDASNLPLIFKPEIKEKHDFYGMDLANVDDAKCIKCMECYNACRFDAITEEIKIIEEKCEGCGVCEHVDSKSARPGCLERRGTSGSVHRYLPCR